MKMHRVLLRCTVAAWAMAVAWTLGPSATPVMGQGWMRTITVAETDGQTQSLRFGVHPGATDGIDGDLGEFEVPPLPPAGALDARFTGGVLGRGLLVDLRPSAAAEHCLTLSFQRARGGDIHLAWDAELMRTATLSMLLQGPLGLEIDMRVQSELTISAAVDAVTIHFSTEPNKAPLPIVRRLEPSSGTTAGGTRVVVAGFDFQNGASVAFGDQPATEVRFEDAGLLAVVSPPGPAGPVDIAVINPDGQRAILEAGFEYRDKQLQVEVRAGQRRYTSPARLRVGRSVRFEVAVFLREDRGDLRPIDDYTWEVPVALGAAPALGELELTTVAEVSESIVFNAEGATAEFRIVTTPASVARIEIEPQAVVLAPGQRQTFRAFAFDRFDNRVLGQSFGWYTVGGIGTIDGRRGDFTAADQIGEGYVIAATRRSLIFSHSGISARGEGKVSVQHPLSADMGLFSNYPNPFNPSTLIHYELHQAAGVELDIFNLAGQQIRRLISAHQLPGTYEVEWDGKDSAGNDMGSGTYLVKLQRGDQIQSRKLLLLR